MRVNEDIVLCFQEIRLTAVELIHVLVLHMLLSR